MKKTILKLLIGIAIFTPMTYAAEFSPNQSAQQPKFLEGKQPPRPNFKEIKQMDKMLEERLKLTPEQIKVLRENKQKNFKELQKTVHKMEEKHKKIRDIYMLGIPNYQAEIKAAPYKMELVILKQNADSIRAQNRKTFEAILTPEQKTEFKKIRSEFPKR